MNATPTLAEQLLAQPDAEAQRQFLNAHAREFDDEDADYLKAQSSALLRSDIQRSLTTAQLLSECGRLAGNPRHQALGLLAEAHARAIGLAEYARACELADEAARLYRAADSPVEEARALIGKVWPLANLGRIDEALRVGEACRETLATHQAWHSLATLTMNMGIIYSLQGKDPEALAAFEEAGEYYLRCGEQGERAWPMTQQNRAVILRNLGRFDESIQASQLAERRFRESGQMVEAARARQNQAMTYYVRGRFNEALEALEEARAIFLADDRRRDAMLAELFTTDCLLQLRRFRDVIEKCQQVRDLFDELGALHVVGLAMVNAAVAYSHLDHYDEARNALHQARAIFQALDNPVNVAIADLEEAAILHSQERYTESYEKACECAALFAAQHSPLEAAQARMLAARSAGRLDRTADARRLIDEVMALADAQGVPALAYQCHRLRGRLAESERDVDGAMAAYGQAITAVERLRGRLMVEFRAGYLEDKQAIYEDMVACCLETGQPALGLDYAERAKSRSLLEMLAYRPNLSIQARRPQDQALVDRIHALRGERDRLYRRWESNEDLKLRGWSAANQATLEVQQAMLTLEREMTDLWHQLLIRNADYAGRAALWQVRTESAQPYLNKDDLLLEYFVVRGELILFLITHDRVDVRRLHVRVDEVQRLLQLLHLNLARTPHSPVEQVPALIRNVQGVLNRLHNRLLGAVAPELATHGRLLIVPHGPLHYLPFHALFNGRRYLVESHAVSYLPGSSFLRYCLRNSDESEADGEGALVVGHSWGGQLPYALEEARQVAALLNAEPLLEEDVDLAAVQNGLTRRRMVHMATHAEFRSDSPLFSGLALADGWLTTMDVFNLRLRASLVTLSACQTGRTVVGGGDELMGLMRAFLSAGANSLLMSLWSVEDRSTARLMTTLYAGLKAGESKRAALRTAQRAFISRRTDDDLPAGYAHPYYWAPFFLVGDPGRL